MIPYGRQSLDEEDVASVVEVLRGDWLTQGPHVELFEACLTDYTGARHAVAFSSGTAALHAAAVAAEIGPGDRVATSPLSFAASAACATYVGAKPVYADIDPRTLNLDLAKVPPDVAAVVPVHYAGLPVDLSHMRTRPPIVIEDAAHALGASTPEGRVGNCARADMCVFSFHPVKAVTTGEGGAVTTNSDRLAERLRLARNHGMRRVPDAGGWYYEIDEPGWNYRMTDIQAALGTSQMRKVETFVDRRNQLANRYRERLAALPIELPPPAPAGFRHAYHLFPIRVPNRRRVYEVLRRQGIGVQVHYVPIYRHRAYAAGAQPADFPETEAAYERLLSLPIYPTLAFEQQDVVVTSLEALL